MNFAIKSEEILPDLTHRLLIEIDSKQVIYLGYFLEAWEGICNYTTPNSRLPILQVDVVNDQLDIFEELIEFLKTWKLDYSY
ncbi:MAG: DUF4911 domain-containing protein [Candidatus Cloacimonadota bacterium]|nr:DUF4911 domain-containing protein [Candidatus Cloacimonadota bacterium]